MEYARSTFPGHRTESYINGKIDRSLPSDPIEIAKVIRERRGKRTPAQKLRAKIDADLKRRGAH